MRKLTILALFLAAAYVLADGHDGDDEHAHHEVIIVLKYEHIWTSWTSGKTRVRPRAKIAPHRRT